MIPISVYDYDDVIQTAESPSFTRFDKEDYVRLIKKNCLNPVDLLWLFSVTGLFVETHIETPPCNYGLRINMYGIVTEYHMEGPWPEETGLYFNRQPDTPNRVDYLKYVTVAVLANAIDEDKDGYTFYIGEQGAKIEDCEAIRVPKEYAY